MKEVHVVRRRTKPSKCTNCGRKLDACTAACTDIEDSIPVSGRLTVCVYCGKLLEFTNTGLKSAAADRINELSHQ